MDGVLTQTAKVHAAAWKEMFDEYLRVHADRTGEAFREFTIKEDYPDYVDAKLRQDGVRSFLASRGISLPEGTPNDDPSAETINGLGNRKNALVVELIRTKGVETYPGSVTFLEITREAGMRTAVVSASKNTPEVLRVTGLESMFDDRVDGNVAAELKLPGKPAPETFLEAARRLGSDPAQCVVFEDAIIGVEAGRVGDFGYVVGVDRVDNPDALAAAGADIVVQDLDELLVTE